MGHVERICLGDPQYKHKFRAKLCGSWPWCSSRHECMRVAKRMESWMKHSSPMVSLYAARCNRTCGSKLKVGGDEGLFVPPTYGSKSPELQSIIINRHLALF